VSHQDTRQRFQLVDRPDVGCAHQTVVLFGSAAIEVTPFDFGTLPIQLRDMTDTTALMNKAAIQFYRNLAAPETRTVLEAMMPKGQIDSPIEMPDKRLPIFVVFDLMFVALRRSRSSPGQFVTPIQGVYAEMLRQNAGKNPPDGETARDAHKRRARLWDRLRRGI
jgi:hypothetical protein